MVEPATKIAQRMLGLSCLPGVGAARLRAVGRQFLKAWRPDDDDSFRDVLRLSGLSVPEISKLESSGAREVDKCAQLGIRILSMVDQEFPARLLEIDDVPPVIYVKGNPDAIHGRCAALVGTRKASRAGEEMCGIAASVLVEEGFSVVSGLALGIDSAAHLRAITEKGKTVAVLAHGLDRVTPAQNEVLAEKILSTGGALVSEHPPGVPPMKAEYVRRNRIQSGMSLCSIIAESGEVGGSIHQAKFTVRQGRKLFVICPNRPPDGFNLSGAVFLIRSLNATPVASREQLRKFLKELEQIPEPTRDRPYGHVFADASLFELGEHGARTIYRGLLPPDGVQIDLGEYALKLGAPAKYDTFATLELTRKTTSFKVHSRWQWQDRIKKEEFPDRNLGFRVELRDAGGHFVTGRGEAPLLVERFPAPGADLDALVVAEVFEGIAPQTPFSPSTDSTHAAQLITRLIEAGFLVVTNGPLASSKSLPGMMRFGVESQDGFSTMQSSRLAGEWPRMVCEVTIRAMRRTRARPEE